MRSFIHFATCYEGDQIKDDEMGGACMHGRGERSMQNCGQKTLNGKDHVEDLDVDGKVIL
jgi:hypothetical protein